LCAAVNFESLSDQLNCPGIRSRLLVSQPLVLETPRPGNMG